MLTEVYKLLISKVIISSVWELKLFFSAKNFSLNSWVDFTRNEQFVNNGSKIFARYVSTGAVKEEKPVVIGRNGRPGL